MNDSDRGREDESTELEETPSGGITSPWEDPVDGAGDDEADPAEAAV